MKKLISVWITKQTRELNKSGTNQQNLTDGKKVGILDKPTINYKSKLGLEIFTDKFRPRNLKTILEDEEK